MSTDNNSDSNDEATGAPTALSETNSGDVHEAADQVQTSLSRFAQGTEGNQENLVALLKQVSQQLRATDATIQKNTAQIDKLSSWIRNSRS